MKRAILTLLIALPVLAIAQQKQPNPVKTYYVPFQKADLDSLEAQSNRAIAKLSTSDAKAKDVAPAINALTTLMNIFYGNYQQQLATDTVKSRLLKKE